MHILLTDRVAHGLQDVDKEPLLPENTIQIRGPRESTFDRYLVNWARRKLSMAVWFTEDDRGNLVTPLYPVFGVFAFRAILRGFFIGASFLPGADLQGVAASDSAHGKYVEYIDIVSWIADVSALPTATFV